MYNLPRHYAASIANFEFTHGIINVPQEIVWYRAYDPSLPLLTTIPLYFGDKATSWLYARAGTGRPLGEFQPRRSLRLLDLRYVMAMLPHMLRNSFNGDIARKITVALGLCTMSKQVELLEGLGGVAEDGLERVRQFLALPSKPDWVHPFETQGTRIGITDIDYEVMAWLKALFHPLIDGVIAPALPSPFHNQMSSLVEHSKLLQELIIFNPAAIFLHIQDVPVGPQLDYNRPTMDFNQLIRNEFSGVWLSAPSQIRWRAGGGSVLSPLTVRDAKAEELLKDPGKQKQWDAMIKKWGPEIRRIRKNEIFLQRASFTMWSVEPEPTSFIH